jgi:hypothetical protein
VEFRGNISDAFLMSELCSIAEMINHSSSDNGHRFEKDFGQGGFA